MSAPTAAEMLAVRREAIGASTDTTTLPDADISYYWENGGDGSVVLTAALCCEMLAAALSVTTFKWSADGASVDKTMQADALRKRALELRLRAEGGGSGSLTITRSEDEDNDDTEYAE